MSNPPARTALFYNPAVLDHDTGAHPECADRVSHVYATLEKQGLVAATAGLPAEPIEPHELMGVHRPQVVDRVRRAADMGGSWLDGDTYVSPQSYNVALLAAGAAAQAERAALAGTVDNAMVVVRPPGHHATPMQSMGFCLFNSVAVAAWDAVERQGLDRVAIVDFDVHHGNGTQDIFYEDPRVLYVSTHQYPYYPGTGHYRERGDGRGLGTTLNVPLPANCGDAEYLIVFEEIIRPALERFAPQLVLVSAGYDAHKADPLAQMAVTTAGYAALVARLKAWAAATANRRLVMVLEGGYDLEALSDSVAATVRVLLGDNWASDPRINQPDLWPRVNLQRLIATVREAHNL